MRRDLAFGRPRKSILARRAYFCLTDGRASRNFLTSASILESPSIGTALTRVSNFPIIRLWLIRSYDRGKNMGKFVWNKVTIDRRIDSHEIRYQCDGAIFLCSTLRVEVFFL